MLAKELESQGIPTAYITTLNSVAEAVGANRIVKGKAIPNVTGDPSLTPGKEREFRKALVLKALEALETEVDSPTTFSN
jgi:betaine reductase